MRSIYKKQAITDLAEKGETIKKIAEIVGCSQSLVYKTLKKNETIKKRKDVIAEDIIAYKAEGHTVKETADRFNISVSMAGQICKGVSPQHRPGHGNKGQPGKPDLEKRGMILSFMNEGLTAKEIAGLAGCSDALVYIVFK